MIRRTVNWLSLFVLATLMLLGPAQAQEARIVARLVPEPGLIADAALLPGQQLALLYPETGRIAVYSYAGNLVQHIQRETGEHVRFIPTACTSKPNGTMYVYDEATYKLFAISSDGNIQRGVNLAYPGPDGQLYALSMVGDLDAGPGDVLWATLPERSAVVGFDTGGNLLVNLELDALLPYPGHTFARAQVLSDHSLFLLDYTQGAVLYREGAQGGFKRLRLAVPEGVDAEPGMQDFAVDDRRIVLAAGVGPGATLRLLVPGEDGYSSHGLQLDLPPGAERLAVRADQGTFIVWSKDEPIVFIIEVEL